MNTCTSKKCCATIPLLQKFTWPTHNKSVIAQFVVYDLTSFLATVCIFSMISAFSSEAQRLGTSPVFRIILISSMKDSSLIWLSANRNTVCLPSAPAFSSSCQQQRGKCPTCIGLSKCHSMVQVYSICFNLVNYFSNKIKVSGEFNKPEKISRMSLPGVGHM